MIGGLPLAVVNGWGKFGTKKLVEELINKDIRVEVVGAGGEEIRNNKWKRVEGWEEIKEEVSYVFDFEMEENLWNWSEEKGSKLVVVSINNRDCVKAEDKLKERRGNWRLIEGFGVYGAGMGEEEELSKLIRMAVANKQLELPVAEERLRLLAETDLVEAILRSCFLSGTAGEVFLVVGEEVSSQKLAEVLITEARMTKTEVRIVGEKWQDWPEELVKRNWDKLRWQPEVGIKEGIKEAMQYFFTLMDEENRRKKTIIKREINVPRFEVAIEEETEPEKIRVEEKKGEERQATDMVVEEQEKNDDNKENVSKWWEVEVETADRGKDEAEEGEINKEIMVVEEEDEADEEKEGVEAVLEVIPKQEEEIEEKEKINEPGERKTKRIEVVEEDDEEMEEEPVVGRQVMIKLEEPMVVKNSNARLRGVKIEEEEKDVEVEKPVVEIKTEMKEIKERKRGGRLNIGWVIMGVAGVMLAVLVAGPGRWGWTSYRAIGTIVEVKELILKEKYDEAKRVSGMGQKKVRKIEEEIGSLGWNRVKWIRNLEEVLKIEEEVLAIEVRSTEVARSGNKVTEGVLGEGEAELEVEIDKVAKGLGGLEMDLGRLEARLKGDWGWVPYKWKSKLNEGLRSLEKVRGDIALGKQAGEVLPGLVGSEGKRRDYLVLFQNEMELRPGGGFIGSYGILSFEGGKLLNLEIRDVYSADGQLKGHVEPPEEVKNYLGEAKWYMRDANWNANFPMAAGDLQWFLEKEMGRKVDGVIGVNLSVASEILGVTGEIFVPDFKEKVNKNNLYEQAEYYAETKFFPGSIQKESFLGLLGKQLFEEIKSTKGEKRWQMARVILDLLERNEIQVAVNDKKTATKLAELGWDGGFYEGKCMGSNCLADYLYVVEANVGVNKANYFIYRSLEQAVDISNNGLSRVLRINYENTAKSGNWPGGDYKNYLRVYLPSEVNMSQVVVYDSDDPTNKKIYQGEELKIKQVEGKKEVGLLVTVPITKKRTVEIRYSSQIDLSKTEKFSYLSYVQRQSGYNKTNWVSLISLPAGWSATQVEPAASVIGGKLLFNQKFDRDMRIGVEISK